MLTVEQEAQYQSQQQHSYPSRQLQTQLIQFILFGCFLVVDVAVATATMTRVACRTFQRYQIEIELNSFLIERGC